MGRPIGGGEGVPWPEWACALGVIPVVEWLECAVPYGEVHEQRHVCSKCLRRGDPSWAKLRHRKRALRLDHDDPSVDKGD